MKYVSKKSQRERKHRRVRKKIFGTGARPRLAVFKSQQNMYAQLIDDEKGVTLVSASSLEFRKSKAKKTDCAQKIGELIAKRAQEKGIGEIVFDRGGFIFAGRIKMLADAARKGGLKF